ESKSDTLPVSLSASKRERRHPCLRRRHRNRRHGCLRSKIVADSNKSLTRLRPQGKSQFALFPTIIHRSIQRGGTQLMAENATETPKAGKKLDSAYGFSFAIALGLILFIAGLMISLMLGFGEGNSIGLI